MPNPCGCCNCGVAQGARSVAYFCVVMDFIFLINSAYEIVPENSKVRRHHSVTHSFPATPLTTTTTLTTTTGLKSDFLDMRSSGPLIRLLLVGGNTIRFFVSIILTIGLEKRKESLIYPWILTTITCIIGLAACGILCCSVLISCEASDTFEATLEMNDAIRSQASLVLTAILITISIYAYFLWVVVAYLVTLRGARNENQRDNNPPSYQSALQNGCRGVTLLGGEHNNNNGNGGIVNSHWRADHGFLTMYPRHPTVHPMSDHPPPAYEDAIKMPHVKTVNNFDRNTDKEGNNNFSRVKEECTVECEMKIKMTDV